LPRKADAVLFLNGFCRECEKDIYDFGGGTDGFSPYGSFIQASDSLLYGMTVYGGVNDSGTIFSYNISTGAETDIHDFGGGNDGFYPYGSLIQVNDSLLYGMTVYGGVNDSGTIFTYNVSTAKETDIHDFGGSSDGFFPYGSLIQASNGLLYGMTYNGGINNKGIIFSYNISISTETHIYDFGCCTDGQYPDGSLTEASNGLLYGMTEWGGAYSGGIILSYNISTGTETDLHNFGNGTDGSQPYGSLIQASNYLFYGMTSAGGVYGDGIIFSFNISTGQEIDLHDFGSGTDGSQPDGSLFQASNGLLYGMTYYGGSYNKGIIFSYNISKDEEKDVYDFSIGTDGNNPSGSLIQASDSLLYGMTVWGGTNDTDLGGYGTIFSYNISTGAETDIHDFGNGTDGYFPTGSLIQASNGLLCGMAGSGGVIGDGIIFSYDISSGTETDLHDFGSGTDGAFPNGSLIMGSTHLLYGMTSEGGTKFDGTVFSYNISASVETDMHDFAGTDGELPTGGLIEYAVTDINQISVTSNQLSIYPNPTSGQFTIELNGNQYGYTVEIYNVVGEKIYVTPKSLEGDFQKQTIDLSSQPDGIYFVYLKWEEGVEVGKVMVTR
jgi:uncharacterized repeat protein (TIGR03803 family)